MGWMHMRHFLWPLVSLLIACGGAGPKATPETQAARDKNVEKYDINRDDKPDSWKYFTQRDGKRNTAANIPHVLRLTPFIVLDPPFLPQARSLNSQVVPRYKAKSNK